MADGFAECDPDRATEDEWGTQVTKAQLNALEKVFAAEIDGRLPFQSEAKVFRSLCDDGYLEPMERKFGGRFAFSVSGYQLTHLGRLSYCSACADYDQQTPGA